MTYRAIFDAKIYQVESIATFNFSGQLAPGDYLIYASVAATVHSGADSAPWELLNATLSFTPAGVVTQRLVGGLLGVTYLLACTVRTNLGVVYSQDGFIVVKAAGS